MNILIIGATSTIARATAAEFAARGDQLYLASRDIAELERIAADLNVRYQTNIDYSKFDLEDINSHQFFLQDVINKMGNIDGVLFAAGYMGDNTQKTFTVNFTSAVSILNYCADYFTEQKHGFIAAISSVAGDRGRQSNYHYCAAKAGLTTYLQGLRNRLFSKQIHVLTIKPGPVDTAMTFGRPGMLLVAKPEDVAKDIINAIDKQKDVIYTPWFWRYIMLIVRLIPEGIFKKLKL